jgi:endonuclease-3
MVNSKSTYFIKIFKRAERKYSHSRKRLAAEGWNSCWKVLIATIMSAQSRDETTIPIAESLFKKYKTNYQLSKAKYSDVLKIFKSLNYNKTKAKNVIKASKYVDDHYKGKIPKTIEELIKIPGVGRKTANLILGECYNLQAICVDTHVHRISNVFGFVHTKTPEKTEEQLKIIAPKEYWNKINRIFVLWGKDVPGHSKERFLKKLEE